MKKILLIVGGIIIVGGAAYGSYKFLGKSESPYIWTEAFYGDIREVISETGTVKSAEEINLNFKNSGTVNEVKVKVGDMVKVGDELISLDVAELELKAREARSAKDAASAKLRSTLAGAPSEDIKVYETAVLNAKANLANTEKSNAAEITNSEKALAATEQTVRNADVSLEDAELNLENVQNDAENDFKNAYENAKVAMEGDLVVISTALGDMDSILGVDNTTANDDFDDNLGVYNPSTKTSAEAAYLEVKRLFNAAISAVGNIPASNNYGAIDFAIPLVEDALIKTSDALYKTWLMLDNSLTDSNLTVAELDTKKSTINADRSSVNTKSSALATAKQSISSTGSTNQININQAEASVNTAKATLATAEKNEATQREALALVKAKTVAALDTAKGQLRTAEDQLALKKANPKEADISYYQAEVNRAEALLDLANKQISDATLKSPIDGIISKVNFKIGETAAPTTVAIALLSLGNFQIETDISELDIAKIKQDDPVEITFEAISEEKIFLGKISSIDPAEKIKDDDIYYRAVIILDEENSDIRSGMTADIDIITNFKSGVLLVPSRAIMKDGKTKKIRILKEDDKMETVVVSVGIEGSETMEILSGIKEGDKVITFIREK
jgi:multidrug efflux pump subunit AcrA (membrane-fusion protein)